MNSDLHYEWAAADDLDEIRSFVISGFGQDSFQAHADRIRWLYFLNPHGVHITACRHEGKLVAVCPHVIQSVSVSGRKIDAAFGIDFYVDPAWRRKGIASQFLTMRRDRFELSLSTGQSPSMHALYMKLGASDLGPMRIAYGRKRPPVLAPNRAFVRGVVTWLKSAMARGLHTELSESRAPTTGQVSKLSDWQRWRYGEPTPYQDHHALVNSDGLIVALARQSNDVLHLLGVTSCPMDRAQLLRSVIHATKASEVQVIFCGQSLATDCARAGYLVSTREARLIAMTNDAEIERLLAPGCVDLMAESSDSDLMRQPPR